MRSGTTFIPLKLDATLKLGVHLPKWECPLLKQGVRGLFTYVYRHSDSIVDSSNP